MNEKSSFSWKRALYQYRIFMGLLCMLLLIITNPSEEVHKQKVNKLFLSSFSDYDISKISNSSELLVAGMPSEFITRKNCIIFSYTKASFDGKENIIGVGILGNVLIYNDFRGLLTKHQDSIWEKVGYDDMNNKTDIDKSTITAYREIISKSPMLMQRILDSAIANASREIDPIAKTLIVQRYRKKYKAILGENLFSHFDEKFHKKLYIGVNKEEYFKSDNHLPSSFDTSIK